MRHCPKTSSAVEIYIYPKQVQQTCEDLRCQSQYEMKGGDYYGK